MGAFTYSRLSEIGSENPYVACAKGRQGGLDIRARTTSLGAALGAANAGEPMQVTADQMDRFTAGTLGFDFSKVITDHIEKVEFVAAQVISDVQLTPGTAFAEAEFVATAEGLATFTDGLALTSTGPGFSFSAAESVSSSVFALPAPKRCEKC